MKSVENILRYSLSLGILEIVRGNTLKSLNEFHFEATKNQSKTRFVWQNQGTMQQDAMLCCFLGESFYQNEVEI